jgi:hypothetical protein
MTVRTTNRRPLVEQLETRDAPAALALSQMASPSHTETQPAATSFFKGLNEPAHSNGIIAILIG